MHTDVFAHLRDRFTNLFGPPRPHLPGVGTTSWTGPGMEVQLRSREGIAVVEFRGAGSGRGTASRLQFTEVRSITQSNILLDYLWRLVEERCGMTRLAGRDAASSDRRSREDSAGDPKPLRIHRDCGAG